ncbi:MAG: PAS domain-containing protein, partial [Dehalococcoidia bacterium]|nr:PAS domain-containing protein [Dehalococcoidia bacterium]
MGTDWTNCINSSSLNSLTQGEQVALLSVVFASSPVAMVFIDSNFVIRAANESFVSRIHLPLEAIVGCSSEDVIPDWRKLAECIHR